MSDTPRTDRMLENPGNDPLEYEWIEFARKLERELFAVTKERDEAIARGERNREMWQDQVHRQSEKITNLCEGMEYFAELSYHDGTRDCVHCQKLRELREL